MRLFFTSLFVIHGMIHLLGFVKAYELAVVELLTKTISKPLGLLWLAAAVLLTIAGILYLLKFENWHWVAMLAVVISQILLILFWQDARFGTILNGIILFLTLAGFNDAHYAKLAKEIQINAKGYQKVKLNHPDVVNRYYEAVGSPSDIPKVIKLKHEGQFKSSEDGDWASITGEQYFSSHPPAFIWKGSTNLFTATDEYIDNAGSLKVRLLNLFKIVDASGDYADDAELQRWITENFFFPANLFFNPAFTWKQIDDQTAELNFKHERKEYPFLVKFNSEGLIGEIRCMRYKSQDQLVQWKGRASNYKTMNGVMVPATIEAVWELETGDHSYAKFHITELIYTGDEPD